MVVVLMVVFYYLLQFVGVVLLLVLVWWMLVIVLVFIYLESVGYWGGCWCCLGMGLLILLLVWQGLVLFKQWLLVNGLIIVVMVLVWGVDIGVYFFGKVFGKCKLVLWVSFGKSWEGVYGGLVVSLVIILVVGFYCGWFFGVLFLVLFGVVLVVFVLIVGDFIESMFKC